MYVCVTVYVCAIVCVCMYAWSCACVYMWDRMCVCMRDRVRMYEWSCVCVGVRVSACASERVKAIGCHISRSNILFHSYKATLPFRWTIETIQPLRWTWPCYCLHVINKSWCAVLSVKAFDLLFQSQNPVETQNLKQFTEKKLTKYLVIKAGTTFIWLPLSL